MLLMINSLVHEALTKCSNVQLAYNAWVQGALPVRFSGLGVRRVADLALSCYLGSLYSTLKFTTEIFSIQGSFLREQISTLAFQAEFSVKELPTRGLANKRQLWDDKASEDIFQQLFS